MSRVLGCAQLAALLAVGLLLLALLAGIAPSLLGYESFVVPTALMQPALQANDLAVLRPVRAATVSVGDIITYRAPDDPDWVIVGRILFIDTDSAGQLQLQVRGDSDPTTHQATVAPTSTLGQVFYSLPRVGLLVSFANGLAGKFVLVGLPGLIRLLDWVRSRARRQPRTTALVEVGWRALRAGYPELALRAANGALAQDASSRAAIDLRAAALTCLKLEPLQLEHAAA